MKKVILLLVAVFMLTCCKETRNKQITQQANTSNFKSLFLKQPRLKLLPLNSTVAKQLETISEFKLIKRQIDTLNHQSYWDKENNLYQLSQEINELPDLLTNTLDNNGVLSRINQLNTYVLLLEDRLKNKQKEDSLVIENHITSILKSYNSLSVQLNETQNKISKDFEKELEKEAFKRDSLEQNEVAPLF